MPGTSLTITRTLSSGRRPSEGKPSLGDFRKRKFAGGLAAGIVPNASSSLMEDLQYYVDAAAKDGPPKPGIILAIRMCLLALRKLEITDLAVQKRRLMVIVETDRRLPDAVQLVTGCRLGNRALKLRDWGKMAAAFIDLRNDRAIRLAARESANQKGTRLFPHLKKMEALSLAYRTLTDEDLYHEEWIKVPIAPEDLPGYRAPRIIFAECGEGVAFHREVRRDGRILCLTCAGARYYDPL